MDQAIKTRWLDALRSGKYKQGTMYLAREWDNEPSFCCLGVLCDLAEQDGVVGHNMDGSVRRYWNKNEDPSNASVRAASFTTLPDAVMNWAGLKNHNPVVNAADCQHTLAGLNDDGVSFDEISGYIEAQL
jgi:hypothetical protein